MVLLRVPMMRRPIFLAYHTEFSMLVQQLGQSHALPVSSSAVTFFLLL